MNQRKRILNTLLPWGEPKFIWRDDEARLRLGLSKNITGLTFQGSSEGRWWASHNHGTLLLGMKYLERY